MPAPHLRALVRAHLRTEIVAGLVSLLDREGQRGVGRLLGLDHSQVSRRGLDLERWTVAELVDLLAEDGGAWRGRLAQALTSGEQGSAATALRDAMAEVGLASQTSGAIAAAMADGRIDAGEAREIRDRILCARAHEDAHLLPALTALAGVAHG